MDAEVTYKSRGKNRIPTVRLLITLRPNAGVHQPYLNDHRHCDEITTRRKLITCRPWRGPELTKKVP